MRPIDLTGIKFGKLTVINRAEKKEGARAVWNCVCDCGKEKTIRATHLRSGAAKSCGCVATEKIVKFNTTHGKANSRIYGVWLNMKNRCYNKKVKSYKHYGGRGIAVCDEWLNSFESFMDWSYANGYNDFAKYSECTIDRIDNNGNYCPSNCRFTDAKGQAKNKRRPPSRKIIQINPTSGSVTYWPGCSDAANALGYIAGPISAVCRGTRKTYKGYKWAYVKRDA